MDPLVAAPVAAASGLNATLPLLTLLVVARLTGRSLGWPLDGLDNYEFVALLGGVALLEVVADKIPGVDHFLHVVWAPMAAAAGAAILASSAGDDGLTTTSGLLGLGGATTALASHGVRALARPVVTASTAGLGNPVISSIEDSAAVGVTLAALLVPVLAVVAFAGWLLAGVLLFARPRRHRG